MLPPYLAEQIGNWASEFAESDAARPLPEEARARAPEILSAFLAAACTRSGGMEGLSGTHLLDAFLEDLPKLRVPESLRPEIPGMACAFLGHLEASGRLAQGRALAKALAAASPAYLEASSGKPKPIRRAGAKLGRNDPCPCGSGRKYKTCCLRG